MKFNKILTSTILVAIISLSFFSIVKADSSASLWKVVGGYVDPVSSSFGLKVSALASPSTPCITVSSTGIFGTTTCSGSSGGTDGNWVFFNNSGIKLATTTNQVVIGASATTSNSKLQVTGNTTLTGNLTVSDYISGLSGIFGSSPYLAYLAYDLLGGEVGLSDGLHAIAVKNVSDGKYYYGGYTGIGGIVINGYEGNVGIGTTSAWRRLSVNGDSDLGNNALAGYFTATSTRVSVLPYASTTAISATSACLSTVCRTTWSETTGTVFATTTKAYFDLLGSVPADAYRVDQFFRALDAAGLSSSLVDGAFLRTTQNNASTSMKTIRGVSTTFVGTPRVGPNGIDFDGVDDYAYWSLTATTEGTVATTFKGAITGQTANGALWSLQNSTGIGTGAGTSGYSTLFNSTATAYVFTYGNSSAAVTSSILDPVSSSASTIHYNNPYEQIDIITNDNAASPTIKAYVDGKLTLNDSSGNVQTNNALNTMVVGARVYTGGGGGAQNFIKGNESNWFVFNRVLTATEAATLTDAMRWLNPKEKNIVYVGDSTSAFLISKPDDAWTYQHSILRKQSDSRIYNQALNGQSASYFNSNYDTLVYPFRPGINGVDKADIYIWLGINDINGGATDSATYTSLKSIWAKARRDGFRVFVGTLMPGTSYNSTMEGYRTALNTSIVSDPSLYDSLFRPDRLLLDATDSAYYLDGFHLKMSGNKLISDMVNMDINIGSSTYFGFASTSQLSVRNNFAMGSTTVNSSALMFSVASSTSSYLAIPTATGNVGVGTTSPWKTLSVVGTMAINGLTATASTADALCLNSTTKEVQVNTGSATCTFVSSAKYKKNIEDLESALSTINLFRPVTFQYKSDDSAHFGLIAEEVAKIDSRLIFAETDGSPRGVQYEEIIPILIKGMQEQDKKIIDLENRIAKLEKQLSTSVIK
jgi:lysophospholipase L1-like esterase